MSERHSLRTRPPRTHPSHHAGSAPTAAARGDARDGRVVVFAPEPAPPQFQGRLLYQRHPRRAGNHLMGRPPPPSDAPVGSRGEGKWTRARGRGAGGDGRAAGRGAENNGPEAMSAPSAAPPPAAVDPGPDAALHRLHRPDHQSGPCGGCRVLKRARWASTSRAARTLTRRAARRNRGPQPEHCRPGEPNGRSKAA